MTLRTTHAVALLICLAGLRAARAEGDARYTAVLVNNRRIAGEKLTGWGQADSSPRLDNEPLLDTPTPLRWLSDNRLTPPKPPDAFVEFVSGDRLPGVVAGMQRVDPLASLVAVPDHLVVEPRLTLKSTRNLLLQQVRVLDGPVRRIVWRRLTAERYCPATVFCRDGRRLEFRRHRFESEGVQLLMPSGMKTIPFDDIAELHLPRSDPWEAYFDEVTALSPDLKTRLFQLETVSGLIATSSELRFRATSYSLSSDQPENWYHVVHPAWSLDAFAVPHEEICMRRYFSPHEVPLSRIAPLRAENRSALHAGWTWQINRSVHGRPLQTGADAAGWGFGVHGLAELSFPMPAAARHFRARTRLDQTAGGGGCVRALVFSEDTAGGPRRQLYRSDLLIGSDTVLHAGNLPLQPAGKAENSLLTLSVDPVCQGHPRGADPLDIRDTLNWLDPEVLLDRGQLAGEVRRRQINTIYAARGWTLDDASRDSLNLFGFWNSRHTHGDCFRFGVEPGRVPLVLSRSVSAAPERKWLIVSVGRPDSDTPASNIEVRIDGQTAAEHEVPVGYNGGDYLSPLAVPLDLPSDRTVKLEIIQRAADKQAKAAAVDWRNIVFAPRLPMLHEVFEDRADFTLHPDKTAAVGELVDEDAWSGDGCLRITPGARVKIDLGPRRVSIRETPTWGEYRYLRFLFRKRGRGQVQIELGHAGEQQQPLRYFAGKGASPDKDAKRVWVWSTYADLPDHWCVVTRDLFADFDRFSGDLTSITLSCTGGTEVLFDHVYLARRISDFNIPPVERSDSAEVTGWKARAAMTRVTLDGALPATVLIGHGEQLFSGVIVSREGLILTAGHVAVAPQRDVFIVLHDGRKVQGKTLGVDRANDVAMIKITTEGDYPFVGLCQSTPDLSNHLLIGVAHWTGFEVGDRPAANLTHLHDQLDGLWRVNFTISTVGSGGPLFLATNDAPAEGQLIGIHCRTTSRGLCYTPIERYRESWQRLLRGEAWGAWAPGTGPLVGIFSNDVEKGERITQLVAGGGAEKAQLRVGDVIRGIDGRNITSPGDMATILATKQPDQEVTVKIEREGKTFDVKVVLSGRK